MASAWEPLDASGRFWGVFRSEDEGCTPDPLAIFRDEASAEEWLGGQLDICDDGDGSEGLQGCREDYCLMVIERLRGRCWNSYEPVPS